MDETLLTTLAPDEIQLANELTAAAARIKPDAQFTAELEARLLRPESSQVTPIVAVSRKHWMRRARIVWGMAAVLVTLVIATLTIPPLRAIAQEVIDTLFNRKDTDEETVQLGPRGIIDLVPYYYGTVEQAEAKAGFDIRAPTLLPDDLILRVVNYSPEEQLVTLGYSRPDTALLNSRLSVLMGPVTNGWSDHPFLAVGASADVIPVQFAGADGQVTGEFVKGFWMTSPSAPALTFEATPTAVEWDSDLPVCRLRWQEDDMVYEIWSGLWLRQQREHDSCPLDQQELVAIAESMR